MEVSLERPPGLRFQLRFALSSKARPGRDEAEAEHVAAKYPQERKREAKSSSRLGFSDH